MKISFCSIAFRNDSQSIEEIISTIAGIGYDGIEIWGNHLPGDLRQVRRIKDLLDYHSLPVSMISPYFDFTSDDRKWKASIKVAQRFIRYATLFGRPLVRVFTGLVGSQQATSEQWHSCVKGLKKITAMAREEDITLALETHPSTLVDTVDSTLKLIEEVAVPNLKVNLDIYHLWEVYQDSLYVLYSLFPYMTHVHAKNANLTEEERMSKHHPFLHDRQAKQDFRGVTELKRGDMDYPSFLKALSAKGFKGYVSVEWFGEHVLETARHELVYLRTNIGAPRVAVRDDKEQIKGLYCRD